MNHAKRVGNITALKHWIEQKQIDFPLYSDHQDCAIKFDFEDMPDKETTHVCEKVLRILFREEPFWVCEYGSNTIQAMVKKQLFTTPLLTSFIIPYHSKIDPTDFVYPHNSIACVYLSPEQFCFQSYLSYALSDVFISNTIFLISEVRRLAVLIYDRRGMDVLCEDQATLLFLYQQFRAYVSKYYLNQIKKMLSEGNDK